MSSIWCTYLSSNCGDEECFGNNGWQNVSYVVYHQYEIMTYIKEVQRFSSFCSFRKLSHYCPSLNNFFWLEQFDLELFMFFSIGSFYLPHFTSLEPIWLISWIDFLNQLLYLVPFNSLNINNSSWYFFKEENRIN